MAARAGVQSDTERDPPVMAGAALLAILHLGHGDRLGLVLHRKERVVTGVASEDDPMSQVRKSRGRDVLGCDVGAGALKHDIPRDGLRHFLRLSLLEFRMASPALTLE